jgi:hypothetical protein
MTQDLLKCFPQFIISPERSLLEVCYFLQRITQTVINSENPTPEKSGKIEKEDLLYDKQKKKAAAKVTLE